MEFKEYFATVRWSVEDLQTLRPDWDDEKCAKWLAQWESKIQDRITELGWEVIETLLNVSG